MNKNAITHFAFSGGAAGGKRVECEACRILGGTGKNSNWDAPEKASGGGKQAIITWCPRKEALLGEGEGEETSCPAP